METLCQSSTHFGGKFSGCKNRKFITIMTVFTLTFAPKPATAGIGRKFTATSSSGPIKSQAPWMVVSPCSNVWSVKLFYLKGGHFYEPFRGLSISFSLAIRDMLFDHNQNDKCVFIMLRDGILNCSGNNWWRSLNTVNFFRILMMNDLSFRILSYSFCIRYVSFLFKQNMNMVS